jgi:hypothetical protein
MKTYKTAEQLLNNVIDLHKQLAEKLLEASKHCSDIRKKMAFDFLYKHQLALQSALTRYLEDTDKSVLETWLPYSLSTLQEPSAFLAELSIYAEMELNAIADLGQSLTDYLLCLFDNASNAATTDQLQQAFKSLHLMTISESKQFTRAMNSLNDI